MQYKLADKIIYVISIITMVWLFLVSPLTAYAANEEDTIKEDIKITNPITKDIERKIDTIAKVIWCEDNRSHKGMYLVLSVIHNRASSKNINELYREIKKPNQFNCYNIIKQKKYYIKEVERFNKAKQLVLNYYNGVFTPIIDAKYFFNINIVNKPPIWSLNKQLVYTYKGHMFYN